MKIMLVSNMYPSSSAPNYGVFVANTGKILSESGFDVEPVVMVKEKNKYLKLLRYSCYYFRILIKGIFKKYDIIYVHYASHNALPIILLKFLKRNVRLYTNVHGSDVVPESNFSEKLQKYVKTLLTISDKVITPSPYYKGLVCRKYGIDGGKVYVFPSGGINTKVFYPAADRTMIFEKHGLDKKCRYIGYVGRIDYKKGWDVLLKSIKELKEQGFLTDKKFIIVGSGKEVPEFQKMIDEYCIGNFIVHFDMLPQQKLNDMYNCMDLFCFPTMREGESLGLVGIEAMACGVPVVGSRIGGLLDYIVDGENGLFFEPGDYRELCSRITEYFGYTPEKKESMRKMAISTSDRYGVEKIKGCLIDIFKQVD